MELQTFSHSSDNGWDGESSPHASGHCDLHNQTMMLTTISEAA